MNASLAIAATTATLAHLLRQALAGLGAVPQARVFHLAADDPALGDGGPAVNVALVAVTHQPQLQNGPRRAGPVLDLTYRISGHGDSEALEPERLLGLVVAALDSTPVLTPGLFADAVRGEPALAGYAAGGPVQIVPVADPPQAGPGLALTYVARGVAIGGAEPPRPPAVPVDVEPGRIVAAPTSVAAFVGFAAAGPVGEATRIAAWSDYEAVFGGVDDGELGLAMRSWFDNGGREASVVRAEGSAAADLLPALHRLSDGFAILCLPDLRRFDGDAHRAAAREAAAFCLERGAFLILDPPSGLASVAQARAWTTAIADALGEARANVAAYWPEPIGRDPRSGATRTFSASGAVAGIYAATDSARGVWKAPAGAEAALSGVEGLAARVSDAEQERLNPIGLNLLRAFPGRGPVVWGARTLAGADGGAPEWKYVPVRRLALFLEASIRASTQWTAFKPNDETLWSELRAALVTFLTALWRDGALVGATPREAFHVACDRSTMTQDDVDNGRVNVVIGFAPLKPAEFVTLRIGLWAVKPD